MPNYRRLISYIYAYEGGVKGKNTGYAKVEVRGEQCRVQVNVKKVYVGGNDIGVYLLSPGKEILIGKIFIRGGSGEFRANISATDVESSGYGIDQCYGLTIHDLASTWQSYTTIWEDAVAQAAEVQLEHVTAENVRRQEAERKEKEIPRTIEEPSGPTEPFPITAEIQRTLEQEEMRLQDIQPWETEEKQPDSPSGQPETAPAGAASTAEEGTLAPASQAPDSENETDNPTSQASNPGILSENPAGPALDTVGLAKNPAASANIIPFPEDPANRYIPEELEAPSTPPGQAAPPTPPDQAAPPTPPDQAAPSMPSGQAAPFMPSEPSAFQMPDTVPPNSAPALPTGAAAQPEAVLNQPVGAATPPGSPLTRPQLAAPSSGSTPSVPHTREDLWAELEDEEVLRLLDQKEQEAKAKMNSGSLWARLQRSYSKVLAFEYDHGCEILSIKPQDIGLLPREIWVYGNNSFLLHGYYNYRHLILARLNTPKGRPRYLLGVPGHYYSNEKYMASMFGFPHFVLAKKQPDEDGRFGYWYTDIRL